MLQTGLQAACHKVFIELGMLDGDQSLVSNVRIIIMWLQPLHVTLMQQSTLVRKATRPQRRP